MATRLFKKPDLKSSSIEVSDSIFRDPRELEAIKEKVKPEVYLQKLYTKISELETNYSRLSKELEERHEVKVHSFFLIWEAKQKEVEQLESVLVFKREEQAELEKPLSEKWARMNERDKTQDARQKELDNQTQGVFEREHECDMRLESMQNMADELSESRVRIASKERYLQKQKEVLDDRETQYLLLVDARNEEEGKKRNELQVLEFGLSLREVEITSKEENLLHREKELLDGFALLTDRRGVLERAWKELQSKYGTTRTAPYIATSERP